MRLGHDCLTCLSSFHFRTPVPWACVPRRSVLRGQLRLLLVPLRLQGFVPSVLDSPPIHTGRIAGVACPVSYRASLCFVPRPCLSPPTRVPYLRSLPAKVKPPLDASTFRVCVDAAVLRVHEPSRGAVARRICSTNARTVGAFGSSRVSKKTKSTSRDPSPRPTWQGDRDPPRGGSNWETGKGKSHPHPHVIEGRVPFLPLHPSSGHSDGWEGRGRPCFPKPCCPRAAEPGPRQPTDAGPRCTGHPTRRG